MKIALLGYGRMGKEIEKIAVQRGHAIVIKAVQKNTYDITDADIAIDFSTPESAFYNISHCITHNIPVVSGTTGWLAHYKDIVALCTEKKGSFLYASNFSLGVNIFFELNKKLANIMRNFKNYSVDIEEIHHVHKVDAPSGTAITLAEGILENSSLSEWKLNTASTESILGITAKRIPEVPGTHTIQYESSVDTITTTHTAHSREGFALGAVIAAEWLLHKKGVYTMKDVLHEALS